MAKQQVLIFIDTNIYLRFFDTNQNNYKKLLDSLREIDEYIFITKQIIDEVNRNKQILFKRTYDNYIEQCGVKSIQLPTHLTEGMEERIGNWNKLRREIEERVNAQKEELKSISSDILNQLLKSEDRVSQFISYLEHSACEYDDDDLATAETRKNLGNPPGKREDPLGDQLNWELFLNALDKDQVEDIIIVSADQDFFFESNGIFQLNAILYNDIVRKDEKINIFCYNTLADGLKKFNELKEVKSLPSPVELKAIKEEEIKSFLSQHRSLDSTLTGSLYSTFPFSYQDGLQPWYQPPVMICPLCKSLSLRIHPVIVDGMTHMEYSCTSCNYTLGK